jgi:hypothetical protein
MMAKNKSPAIIRITVVVSISVFRALEHPNCRCDRNSRVNKEVVSFEELLSGGWGVFDSQHVGCLVYSQQAHRVPKRSDQIGPVVGFTRGALLFLRRSGGPFLR